MANHPSAEKRHRQSLKRRENNKQTKAAIKTTVKKAEALSQTDKNQAQSVAKSATSLLAKAATKGILHKNNVRRRISRLSKKIAKSS